jgi:acyl-CoA synthetase (AMP-forming)/AMP-acid ligase II
MDAAPATLLDLLRLRAADRAGQLAYRFLSDDGEELSWTYSQLDQRARAIAVTLREETVAGDRAILCFPPGLEFIAAFFGCLYAGVVPVPAPPPHLNRRASRQETMITDCGHPLLLTTVADNVRLTRRRQPADAWSALRRLCTDDIPLDRADAWHCPDIHGQTLALLQYTSGSTGDPKGVMVSHANLLHNLSTIPRGYNAHGGEMVVTWLPLYHDMGLIAGMLETIYMGSSAVILPPISFLQQPVRWLQAISRYGASMSGAPNFAYDLCVAKISDAQCAELNLSNWEIAVCSAEPIRQRTMKRFTERFAPCGFRREAFFPCFGMAEATLMVTCNRPLTTPTTMAVDRVAAEQGRIQSVPVDTPRGMPLVGCGQPRGGTQVAIVDPATRLPVTADRVGEIWVAGPSVALGYWNRPELTRETFGARLADSGEGPFLRTGDLGFLRGDQLYVVGRLKELIIIRGRNHYPADIEDTARECDPDLLVNGTAAFAVDEGSEERLVIVQELPRHGLKTALDKLAEAMRTAIVREYEVQPHRILFVSPFSIPKTTSGKVQRSQCRDQVLQGTLKVVAEVVCNAGDEATRGPVPRQGLLKDLRHLSPESRRTLLMDFFRHESLRILGKPPRTSWQLSQPISSLGLDSLVVYELKNRIESELGIRLPVSVFFEDATVDWLVDRLLEQFDAGTERLEFSAAATPVDCVHQLSAEQVDALLDAELAEQDRAL